MTDTGAGGRQKRSISRRWPTDAFFLDSTCHFEDHEKTPVSRETGRLPQGNQSCRRATGNTPPDPQKKPDRQTLPISAPQQPHQSSQRNRTTGSLSPAKLVPFFAATDIRTSEGTVLGSTTTTFRSRIKCI